MTSVSAPVSQYMTEPIVAFPMGGALDEALASLVARKISAAPVIDDAGHGIGVVSRTDLMGLGRVTASALGQEALLELPHVTVETIMSKGVITVLSTDSVASASRLMIERGIHRVFVGAETRLVGVFSTKDVLKSIIDERIPTPIEELMAVPVYTIGIQATLAEAVAELERAHVAGLSVSDKQGFIVGTFSQREAVEAKDRDASTLVESVMSPSLIFLDRRTPVFRAAAHAFSMGAKRVIATENGRAVGVLTGLDFARAVS